MLSFQLNLLIFLRITALSLANPVPVPLEDVTPLQQFPADSSLYSSNDDSISSSSISDSILSSNNKLVSNINDATPGLLMNAGDRSSWDGGTSSSPQQQQQSQEIASCGVAPNKKRAEAGQQQKGAGGGEANVCHAPLDYTAPPKAVGPTQQTETETGTEGKKKKKEPGEFYDGGGPRPGPLQIFPSDQDVELQNGMQAAKNRQLQLDDPARCNFAPFFVHTCCDGELGPAKYDEFKGMYYQFVGFCILREFPVLFPLLRYNPPSSCSAAACEKEKKNSK